MGYKLGNKGWMAIKIDLEKAYDRLKWNFVKDTLQDIGLPQTFVNLIWASISSPRLRMVWNGEALEEFTPSRGIRQGDPISPYLFVLCMERLFQLI
uniref:LINE-1 reverse transcriptase isogeny n=1 Tax=Cajanus cajan TaxID=3821 RepID=A0A151R0Z7_CAJCA|nr:LINE-1 reverse transcriptase isogeny [Cajanus cajan]